ncbi:CLUMA_CG005743, isoform A [Clunio marinus]|uniref:Protein TEX261 n=1 Tax=Clunio marinus TaxID=568069 RepID=A0A1J1HXR0_9DIPT|nr:CLUMA_CG005743, isoform A [Clunio marinus]
MGFALYLLSYVSILVHICFVTISFAAGLYYISEIVEEYTEKAKKAIKLITIVTIVIYLLLIISEEFTWTLIICGVLAHFIHLAILRNFPNIKILSIEFWSAVILLLLNHYLAYKHFQEVYYSLSEILGYFTLCLWLVPFSLFVSLSANDQVLPSYQEVPSNDNDVVTNYFSSRKRQNLLNFFKSAKSSVLPTRSKKSF